MNRWVAHCSARCVVWLLVASASVLAQGRVTQVGKLATARSAHTATLLPDGRVLIVGGRGADGLSPLSSVELYEPKTNKWSQGAPLKAARANHSATLLNNGRVLVVGGATFNGEAFGALASAELYEPKTNTWSPAGELAEARQGHAAAVLPDGKLLIAGGAREKHGAIDTTELYEPAKNQWVAGPKMMRARMAESAVAQADGGVLLIAGRSLNAQGGGSVALTDVERCSAERCEALAPLHEARQRHASIATNDGVLVIGGLTATGMTNYVERETDGVFALAATHLPAALAGHTATALSNGDVLVTGGETPNTVDTAAVLQLRRGASAWCQMFMSTSRKGHTATLLKSGSVLIVGGTSSGMPEATAELWTPAKGECAAP